MTELHAALAARVDDWRAGGYAHDRYPAIAEILRYAVDGEDPADPFPASGSLRYLRAAQFRAVETYCICGWSRARPTSPTSTATCSHRRPID